MVQKAAGFRVVRRKPPMLELWKNLVHHVTITDRVFLTTLFICTVTCLYVRRHTWRNRWESGLSAAAGIKFVGLALTSPQAAILNPWGGFQFNTGVWRSHVVWGNCFLVAAMALVFYDLTGRMHWSPRHREYIVTLRITLPVTFFVPMITVAWWTDIPTMISIQFVAMYLWFTLNGLWLLNAIRRDDRRARFVLNAYLLSFALTFCAIIMRIVWCLYHFDQMWGWRLACVSAFVFQVGATSSWLRKTRFLKVKVWRRIRLEKRLKRKPVPRPACYFDPGTDPTIPVR